MVALLVGAAGCASLPEGSQRVARDPFERVNRGIFAFNDRVDQAVTKPLARAYQAAIPEFVRQYVGNFFGNAADVSTAVNQLLQGKPMMAASDAGRVVVNTVFGIVGLVDVASELGLEKHREDFGQTLGRWGIGTGPFLVLPLLGPSNFRDGIGTAVDITTDPLRAALSDGQRNGAFGLRIVDTRQQLLGAERVAEGAALDRYSFYRDAYLQRRRNQIYDGDPPPVDEPESDAAYEDETKADADAAKTGSTSQAAGSGAAPVPSPPAAGQPATPAER